MKRIDKKNIFKLFTELRLFEPRLTACGEIVYIFERDKQNAFFSLAIRNTISFYAVNRGLKILEVGLFLRNLKYGFSKMKLLFSIVQKIYDFGLDKFLGARFLCGRQRLFVDTFLGRTASRRRDACCTSEFLLKVSSMAQCFFFKYVIFKEFSK